MKTLLFFLTLCLSFQSIAQKTGSTTVTTYPTSAGSCPMTVGTLTLSPVVSRSSGISPLLVFLDASGSTDSATLGGANNAFQDVYYSWNFGDAGPSGTATWLYGSNPNQNSRNLASGPEAAHLYITTGFDQTYNVTVTAFDGTNTASCIMGITAFDPSGSNGFPGTATICQAASTTPIAGSGGCPAGAAVSNSASEATNLSSSMTTKRVLFKCGDSFTGGANFGGNKYSIGAYGGCEGTQSNRPIFSGTLTNGTGNNNDGRISDIDFESSGSAVNAGFPSAGNQNGPMVLWNLLSNGNATSYYYSQGQQWGLVQVVMTGMTTAIGAFLNYGENNCANLNATYQCGQGASAVYQNINYMAVMGSHFDGNSPGGSSGIETVRVSAARLDTITNSDFLNSNPTGSVLKFHSGNTFNTQCIWIGQYTEMNVISDNFFGGNSGGQLVEVGPQNGVTDERLRNIIVERNVFNPHTGTNDALMLAAMNVSVRDNAFNMSNDTGDKAVHIGRRGFEFSSNNTAGSTCSGSGTTGAPVNASAPQYDEIYNNSAYANAGAAYAFSGGGDLTAPGNNGFAENNLLYTLNGGTVVSNSGTGNTVSNNTSTVTNNPSWINGSATLLVISDFKPTANYTGATSVPNWYDALSVAWAPIWDLGAVHP